MIFDRFNILIVFVCKPEQVKTGRHLSTNAQPKSSSYTFGKPLLQPVRFLFVISFQ